MATYWPAQILIHIKYEGLPFTFSTFQSSLLYSRHVVLSHYRCQSNKVSKKKHHGGSIATATQKKVLRNLLTNQQQQKSTRNSSIFVGHNNPNNLIRHTLQIPLAKWYYFGCIHDVKDFNTIVQEKLQVVL